MSVICCGNDAAVLGVSPIELISCRNVAIRLKFVIQRGVSNLPDVCRDYRSAPADSSTRVAV